MFRQYAVAILLAAAAALFVRFFFLESFRVPTSVMKPTLLPGDLIFVEKWPFGFRIPFTNRVIYPGRMPEAGEVVVYAEITETTEESFIKRVVGLPGDTVSSSDGRIFLNGKILEFFSSIDGTCGRERLGEKAYPVCLDRPLIEDFGPMKVPGDCAFVISDLRSKEASRKPWDLVPLNAIRGKVLSVWLSIDPLTSSLRPDRLFKYVW